MTFTANMDKIFTIKERILYFIENQDIKKVDFFNKTQIASSNFKGEGKKSEIGGDKMVRILTEYPQISAEWLLTGVGEMLKSNKIEVKTVDNEWLLRRFEEVIAENALLKQEIEQLKSSRGSFTDTDIYTPVKEKVGSYLAADPVKKR